MDDAACKGVDTRTFYPEDPDDEEALLFAQKHFCYSCPVRLQCHDAGMAGGEDEEGIWGGNNHAGRNRIRRKRSS